MTTGTRIHARHSDEYVEVVRALGRGGFGTVAEVVWCSGGDRGGGKSFAAKVSRAKRAGAEAERVQLREAMALVRMPVHPNVVRYKNAFVTEQGALVILVELAPGGSCLEHVASLDCGAELAKLAFVLSAGVQLARGLAHAHRHGIVHQDVSPANALVFPAAASAAAAAGGAEWATVKLADFGLSGGMRGSNSSSSSSSSSSTAAELGGGGDNNNAVCSFHGGHRWFRSPEQARGESLTAATDTWSLGATLLYLSSCTSPQIPPPWRFGENAAGGLGSPALLPELRRLLGLCFAQDPTARPSADECATELESAFRAVVGHAHPPCPAVAPVGTSSDYDRASLLLESGDAPGAEQVCRAALQRDPDSTEMIQKLVWVLKAKAGECWPHRHERLEAHLSGAQRRELDSTRAEAAELMCRVVELEPSNAAALANYGEVLVASEQFEAAGKVYRRALELEPRNTAIMLSYAGSVQFFEHGGGEEEREKLIRSVLEIDPSNVQALTTQAWAVLHDRGCKDTAEALYRRAIAVDPLNAITHFELGTLLSSTNDASGAEVCYRRAVELKPEHAKAHFNLGICLAKHNAQEAEASYRRAIAIEPRFADAHGNLGNLLRAEKRDLEGAEASFRCAIAADPQNVRAQLMLAVLLWYDKKDADGAESCLRRAIGLDPRCAEAHGRLGCLLHEERGDLDGAEMCYRRAVEVDASSAQTQFCLACFLQFERHDIDGAVACLRRAAEADERLPGVLYNLAGLLTENLGEHAEAEGYVRKLIEFQPQGLDGYNLLGDVLKARGDPTGAEQAFRHALHLDPSDAGALEGLTELGAEAQLAAT
jgi:tetratricopeptide (TPR) repeat protein/serine/threonine protein kinase